MYNNILVQHISMYIKYTGIVIKGIVIHSLSNYKQFVCIQEYVLQDRNGYQQHLWIHWLQANLKAMITHYLVSLNIIRL